MQTKFIVSKDDKELGPWTPSEVVEKLNQGEIQLTDYVFDESQNDWVLLMECSPIGKLLQEAKPKKPPKTETPIATKSNNTSTMNTSSVKPGEEEWFILKWDNKYGPFAYHDILRMLQEKSVFEFDFVWKDGFEDWMRIAEVPAFQAETVRNISVSSDKKLSDSFFRRRHVRTSYNGAIIVHDNKGVWKAKGFEISEGGAGLVINNSMLLPGQKVYLHFKPGDEVPPFNAICEIVSKKYSSKVRDRSTPMTYGVKFERVNKESIKAIRDYVKKAA